MTEKTNGPQSAMQKLFDYSLMDCLAERRTRRIPQGVSLDAGELSHQSENQPYPLTKLEEAVLICSMGTTGVSAHDGPVNVPGGGKELGTPFLHVMARSGSSADNCQATSFFMINDEGIWLIKRPVEPEALNELKNLPPRWSDWSEADYLATAEKLKVKISDRRLEFPREYPYYLGWNKQMSNVEGTTVFFPVVDCTRQYINALLIVASEPDGKRPIFVDDWQKFNPKTAVEWLAWLGGIVGLTEKIPYHVCGGLKWVRNGFVNKDNVAPLGFGNTLRTDYECFFYFQNLMLVGQAMGIGGWIHGSVFPPYIYYDDPDKGWHGLGFRMQEAKKLSPMAPVPASQPNPVGIDGILEGLCPPYVGSMDEAVDIVVEEKYGKQGAYGNIDNFARSYKSRSNAEEYLKQATHFTPQTIAFVKEMCNYLYDTYGRFPAHVDAYYSPGMFLQFHHLEMEYYDKFYNPAFYTRQREMQGMWGSEAP